jgi:zinc/manganese transport system substrate-binding protein
MRKTLVARWRIFLLTLLVLTSAVLPHGAVAALQVVTTVAPLTDMVQQVGGDLLHVHGLVPEGMNAHTFQPAPSDVQYLARADLLILNGLHLEIPIEKLIQSSGKPGVTVLKLGEHTVSQAEWVFDASFPRAQGHPNPHLWLNVDYAMHYVTLIRDQVSALDGDHAAVYHQNAARYLTQLAHLDRCIMAAMRTLEPHQHKLLTYHDSWPYFARRYGLTIVGAVQPANFSEPSPREVARLIDQLRREKVPAVFGSEVFPSKVLHKIAAEAGVRYVTSLRDDVLPGAPGEPDHSYTGMMRHNVTTMLEALGGTPATFATCLQETATR